MYSNYEKENYMITKKFIDVILVILAFLSVSLLMYEIDHPEVVSMTFSIDFCIAIIFLSEYIASTHRAPKRLRYALSHWYDLLASIPLPFSAVRMFRSIRLVRMVRLMRLLKVSRAFAFLEESRIGHVVVAFLMITLFGSISIHILEHGQNPTITSSLDALYWALATISTVGFGDIVAITSEGRILTIGLMIAGIGIYASLASLLASYFVSPRYRTREKPLVSPDLEERVIKIERKVDEISKKLEMKKRQREP